MTTSNLISVNRSLRLARLAWVGVCLLCYVTLAASLSPLLTALQTVCEGCQPPFLNPQNLADLQGLGLSSDFYVGYQLISILLPMLAWVLVGLVILLRRSDDWVAIFFSGIMIVQGIAGQGYPFDALVASAPAWWLPASILEFLATSSLFLMIYLFPNGRWIPRWTRWFALGWLVISILTSFFSLRFSLWPEWLAIGVNVIFLLSLILAQGYRYLRFSSLIERQQTKWALFGIFGFAGILLIFGLSVLIFPALDNTGTLGWGYFVGGLVLSLASIVIPISIGIAILKSRLWDIDVIIRKTLVYGILTALLGLIYFGVVTLLETILSSVTGPQSTVAIVLSTLAIAALFTPLRRRVQNTIDRRFYRRKYDAEKALVAFALTAREEVDLESLSRALLEVVDETLQPESTSIWLRGGG